jgi:photosystem II stability/assembly factor-like uncharacterized protein
VGSFLGKISRYFDSEWSYAKFKVPSEDQSALHTCAFNQEGSHLIVVGSEGTYYQVEISKKGECKIVD